MFQKKLYNINVDKPTKTVTIHSTDSPYQPAETPYKKCIPCGSNEELGRDGGWFTGCDEEMKNKIIEIYESKGYTVRVCQKMKTKNNKNI